MLVSKTQTQTTILIYLSIVHIVISDCFLSSQFWQRCCAYCDCLCYYIKLEENCPTLHYFLGATAISGDGCFMAEWGCPDHKGPADGHILTSGILFRDSYAEQHGGHDIEEQCLKRALAQWRWCGSHVNHPVTSIYRPTGL